MESPSKARIFIEQFIENIVSSSYTLTDDSYLVEMGIDSLDVVELVMELEEELNMDIEDDAFSGIETVGALIQAAEKLAEKKK